MELTRTILYGPTSDEIVRSKGTNVSGIYSIISVHVRMYVDMKVKLAKACWILSIRCDVVFDVKRLVHC